MPATIMLAAVASPWREERISVQPQTLIYPDLDFTATFDELSIQQFLPRVIERKYVLDAIPSF